MVGHILILDKLWQWIEEGMEKAHLRGEEVIHFSIKWKVQEITLYDFMLKTEYRMN